MTCPDIAEWDELSRGAADAARAAALRGHLSTCPGCREVAANVESNERALAVLRRSLDGGMNGVGAPADGGLALAPGTTLGGFTIVRMIGSGGMATVFEATQERPNRTVALKVMTLRLESNEARERFAREVELLGRLQHPGIARIYAAGGGATGPPWLAMELVRGLRLDEWATQRPTTVGGIVALMAEVCEAVDYAHARGVVHRDLKPANILVEEARAGSGDQAVAGQSDLGEGEPRHRAGDQGARGSAHPKVLDFGVACAVGGDGSLATLRADTTRLVGTLAYMSPEQASGRPEAADARSDVYALGAITYELLSGRLPHPVRERSIAEAARLIQAEDPPRLSRIRRSLGGDLETIVGKALERDPAQRYQSAAEFGADLRRFLRDEPIAARRPTAAYRARKFVARHTVLVGATAVVVVALSAGLAAATYGLLRATAERNLAMEAQREAQAKRDVAEAVTGLLQRMLASANPHQVRGRDFTVRQLLDDFTRSLESGLEHQPETEAAVRATVGNAYRLLGVYDAARVHLTRALELRREHFGVADDRTIQSEQDFAWLVHDEADYASAATRFRGICARLADRKDTPAWAAALTGLSDVLRHLGELEEAERWGREAVRARQALAGPAHADTGASLINLSKVLYERGSFVEAQRVGQEGLEALHAAHGPEHPTVADALNHLAWLAAMERDFPRGEALARSALEMGRKLLGDRHPDVANSLYELGYVLNGVGRHEEAETCLREALAIFRAAHGAGHPSERTTLSLLAAALRSGKDYAGSEDAARQAIDAWRRSSDDPGIGLATALNELALTLRAKGDLEGAEASIRSAMDIHARTVGDDHPFAISARLNLGVILQRQARLEEADACLTQAVEAARRRHGPGHVDTLRAVGLLARLWAQQERHAEAEALLAGAITAAESAGQAAQGGARPSSSIGALMGLRAASLDALGRTTEADELRRQAQAAGGR